MLKVFVLKKITIEREEAYCLDSSEYFNSLLFRRVTSSHNINRKGVIAFPRLSRNNISIGHIRKKT